jgi:hypothetical protein
MSESKKDVDYLDPIKSFDVIVDATSNFLRTIFPYIYFPLRKKKTEDGCNNP